MVNIAAALVAAMFVACGGSGDPDPTPTERPPLTLPTRVPTQLSSNQTTPPSAKTVTSTGTATVETSPTADVSPTAQVPSGPGMDAAIAAALGELDAIYVAPLTFNNCLADNPGRKICIELVSSDESAARGIARFTAGDPEAGMFDFYMGRLRDGSWGYWFGAQQTPSVLANLPGAILACGPGGGTINVRSDAAGGSEVVGTLNTLDTATAEEFVLLSAAAFGRGTSPGAGAYRIASGWVDAADISDASHGDCTLHDDNTGNIPHG